MNSTIANRVKEVGSRTDLDVIEDDQGAKKIQLNNIH